MTLFTVVDLLQPADHPEQTVEARTPEAAALIVLGSDLVRSGSVLELRAKVYWQAPNQPQSMVRLYTRAKDR